jgi:DNA polymerase-1
MNYVVIDGMNLAFRAHYAFQKLSTSTGLNSGCIYGFLSIMRSLKLKHTDCQFVVAWDNIAKRKKDIYSSYKSNRVGFQEMDQIRDLKELLSSLNIHQYGCPGEEADDVIATFVEMNKNDEGIIYIYSADKDLMHLVKDGKVIIIRPRSGKDLQYFDEEAVKKEMGVSPNDISVYLAFRGDTVDNIPGISRVKSSLIASIVDKYKSPENIYLNLNNEKMTPFQRESFKNFENQINVNYSLTTLKRDLDCKLVIGTSDEEKMGAIFSKYGIKAFSPNSYISIFDKNTSFLNKYGTVENYSLF